MLKTKIRRALLLAMVATGLVLTIGFATKAFSSGNVMIDLTPSTFNPVRVSSRTFDVSSGANGAGMLATGVQYSYSDPNHFYPGVSIFQSDPYMSYDNGTARDTSKMNTTQLLATSGRLVIGDQVFYEHEYTFTEQIGVRNLFNFVDPGDTTSYVSPFADRVWTVSAGQTYTDGFGAGYTTQNHHVDGVLCMYDQFDQGYFLNYEAATPQAKISSSMTRIYFPTIQLAQPNDGKYYYTPEGAVAACESGAAGFGNAGIYIYPHITIQGMSNYISYGGYNYNLTLPNGTTTLVHIKTNSAIVGFVDARKTGIDQQGDVPAVMPVAVNPKTQADISNPTTSSTKAIESYTDPTGVTHTVLSGYIHPSSDTTDMNPSGGYNQVLGYTTSLDNTNININLSKSSQNYGMAQNLVLTPSFFLQPKTTVVKATANIQWASDRRYTYMGVTTNDDNSWTGSASVYWPCGVKLVNQWAITQFTFRVAIITSNQIGIVTSNGHQLNATEILKDFGANSILRDPMSDLTDVTLKTPNSYDPLAAFNQFLAQWGWIGIIIIAVVLIFVFVILFIAGSWIVNKVKRVFGKH